MPTLPHYKPCTNASCTQYIAALESQIQELELLVKSVAHESQEHRPWDTTASLPTIAATRSVLPTTASQPLSPASKPPRCPDLESQSFTGGPFPRLDLQPIKTPENFLESKPAKSGAGKKLVNRFIESIPHDEQEWQEKGEHGGLMNPVGILEAFGVVASSTFEAKPSGPLREKFSNHIFKRSEEIKEALCKPNVADVLLIWGPVIFLGECRVALTLGVELAVVNTAINQVLKVGRHAAIKTEPSEKTLEIYRHVPVWITQQMDNLYGGCEHHPHRAFQIFPLAKMTIAMYDKLSKPDFSQAFDKVLKLLASDPAAPEQTSFPLYPPFIVWAIIRLQLGYDCYNEVSQAFHSRTFLKLDFETWYALLSKQLTTPTSADKQDVTTMVLTHHKHPLTVVSNPEPKRKRIGNQSPPSLSRSRALDPVGQAVSLSTSSDPALSCDGGDATSAWDDKPGHTLSTQDPLCGNTTAPADITHAGFFQHTLNLSDSLPPRRDIDGLHVDRWPAIQSLHTASSTAHLLDSASGAIQPSTQNEPTIEPRVLPMQPSIMVRAQETTPRTGHPPLVPLVGRRAVESAASGMNVTNVYAGETGIGIEDMLDDPSAQVPLEDGNLFHMPGANISPYSGDYWPQALKEHQAGCSQMGRIHDFSDYANRLVTGQMAASGGYLVHNNSGALDERAVWISMPNWADGDTDVDMIKGLEQTLAF